MQRAHFNGSSEIGAYSLLTNNYMIIGASKTPYLTEIVQDLVDVPIIETTINSISTVGSLTQGNKYGLLIPTTTHDHEMAIIRHLIPEHVRLRRMEERLNALGNIIVCNDYVCVVNPEIDNESVEIIENVLNVPVHKMCIGNNELVGTYAVMNNQGMMVESGVKEDELLKLSQLFKIRVVAGTVNMGKPSIGGGIVVNDRIGFCGKETTNPEIGALEKVFVLREQ